jgi:hypothetical protein
MSDRRIIDMHEPELRALVAEEVAKALAVPRKPPPKLDREGLAEVLAISSKQLDRLRAEPGFPQDWIGESPRFDLERVLLWFRARHESASAKGGLRVVEGGAK